MPASTCDWYLITCLTHLHAGRGDTNYDIVDKEVQRDPINELPVIHASSLKGALREWFRQELPGETDKKDSDVVNTIFGNDTKRGNSTQLGQGTHQFFEGRLLALPVRCSHLPFMLATSKTLLIDCLTQLTEFGLAYEPAQSIIDALNARPEPVEGHPLALTTRSFTEQDELMLDDYTARTGAPIPALNTLLGFTSGDIALFHDTDLKELAGRLPVIARNNLENGRSVNLWYEEIVPRQTRFTFLVRHPHNQNTFYDTLHTAGRPVQIGANATIGYGQCTMTRLPTNTLVS
ncbi:type III-B CRISPR module RAMP protein Cmr4 [Spirosoma sordidisoli]|uniref:Type III-B CRISPR module RAMP protein Cmr4 n=1 Tax=Spirosoma sordidisoli TaxID=2502893 RepID=A0A4Q2ULD6_9BACT|nr:type III-B CRISPR module RAMP protein Cmr4 [Spirosoma sordidisoli]RYC70036.1 type III-B CRISPR module RAMP protein Cmr4 [Spirosoma sordidisoli]